MREGEEGDSFYIIVAGTISVLSGTNSESIGTLTTGDYCGEQALLQNTTRNASLLVTSAKAQCLVCKQNIFRTILENNSSIQFTKRHPQRKALVAAYDHTDDDHKVKDNQMPESTKKWLLRCIDNNVLFKELSIQQKKAVFSYMTLITVEHQEFVIVQGDENDKASTFYVVESGEYDTFIDGVKRPSAHYARGGWFGELALLHNSPRAASIQCVSTGTDNKLWSISRSNFRRALTQLQRSKTAKDIESLKTVDLFKPLLHNEIVHLNDALDSEVYMEREGEFVYKQGDAGDKFYVIKKGKVKWSKTNGESGILSERQFFGERALRTKNVRAANISIATDDETILLCMNGQDFEELLGPVIQIIDKKIDEYKRTEVDDADAPKTQENEAKKESETKPSTTKNICGLSELKTIGVLGKGGFGLVTLVGDPNTNETYALKSIAKCRVIEAGLTTHIISEKTVMEELNNKFVVNLHRTYKDKLRVYFLLDACLGGELFTVLRTRRFFNERTARFYGASVIEGFDYMHSKDIIYRDLKPENLVLDTTGYLKITDFGFAKHIPNHKTFTFCGTPDYLCPEIISGKGHGKGVDWWTLGILLYEMQASFAPFVADETIQTYRKILSGKIRFPKFFKKELRDLICKLLQHRPTRRYGVLKGGANRIRKHVWFTGFDWDALREGTMKAPIVNKVKSKSDLSHFVHQQQLMMEDGAQPIDPNDEFDDEF
eukprot:115001_1